MVQSVAVTIALANTTPSSSLMQSLPQEKYPLFRDRLLKVPLTSDLYDEDEEEDEEDEDEDEEEEGGGEMEGGGEAECSVSLRLVFSISSQSANWCLWEVKGDVLVTHKGCWLQ